MFGKSFQGKIILPTVVILVILVVSLNFYLSVRFLEYSNHLIHDKIISNINSLKGHLDWSRNSSKVAAISTSLDIDIIKSIKENNTKKIINLLIPMLDLYRISYFTVCDNNGIVLARTHDPENFGDSALSQQNVKDALDGKISSYFESGTVVKVSIRTGAPVYDADGILIGVVSAGVRFDQNSEVDGLKELLNAEATVFYGNTRIATTITQDGQRVTGTTMDPAIAEVVIEERREYVGDADILGVKYKTFYMPLLNAENEAFATFFVGMPIAQLKKASDSLIRDGITIGLFGLAISITLLFFIILSISKPIIMLADDMENIADGNLTISTKIKTDDELGRLSKSLHHVVSIIHKLVEDINIMITEQEKGNTDYCLDTQAFHGDYKVLADHILELADFGMKDQLTGIPNRRSFDNRMYLEWKRAIRDKKPISILIIDVDKFKNYNDTFGHQQGDVALRMVAKAFTQSIKRAVDFGARWGGEEFIILLPDTDERGAVKVAEKIRAKIEHTVIPCTDARGSHITVSVGAATQIPIQDSSFDHFISQADAALYRAKETGRNRVVFNEGGGE